jgi:hypothetical protein
MTFRRSRIPAGILYIADEDRISGAMPALGTQRTIQPYPDSEYPTLVNAFVQGQ